MHYYQERRYLSHNDLTEYQGWFILTWLVFPSHHVLINMERA